MERSEPKKAALKNDAKKKISKGEKATRERGSNKKTIGGESNQAKNPTRAMRGKEDLGDISRETDARGNRETRMGNKEGDVMKENRGRKQKI